MAETKPSKASLKFEVRRLAAESSAGGGDRTGEFRDIWDLVARVGREFRGVQIPAALRNRRSRKPGQCYHRAWTIAMERGDYFYVEGFGRSPEGFVLQHAWLTSGEGDAIDLAWGFDEGSEYFGVALATDSLARATFNRGGEIGGYLGDRDLLRDGFGKLLEMRTQIGVPVVGDQAGGTR